MVEIPAYQPKVRLIHCSGTIREFPSLLALVHECSLWWLRWNLALDFQEPSFLEPRWYSAQRGFYIARTEFDEPVTFETVRAAVGMRQVHAPSAQPGAPVPNCGRRHYRHSSHRRPRTTNERRLAALTVTEDGEVPPRPRRGANTLPSSYDDISYLGERNRNWKRYRRSQWKGSQVLS